MNNRKYIGASGAYRFGFQKQEIDDELWNGATSFKYRMEDPRIGRFFSVDPLAKKFAYNSPYAFSENRVIDGFELEGLEVVQIGVTGGGSYFVGAAGEGGVVFGPDGAYAYGSIGLYGTNTVGGNLGVSVSYYGAMETIDDVGGFGGSFGTGAGEGGYLAENTIYSSGNWGINFQAGLTGKVFAGWVQGGGSFTKIDKDMVLQKSTVQAYASMAEKALSIAIEKNKAEINNLKSRNEYLDKDSGRLEKLLSNGTNLEQSKRIDTQLDTNRSEKANNEKKVGELEKTNKDAEEMIDVINKAVENFDE